MQISCSLLDTGKKNDSGQKVQYVKTAVKKYEVIGITQIGYSIWALILTNGVDIPGKHSQKELSCQLFPAICPSAL